MEPQDQGPGQDISLKLDFSFKLAVYGVDLCSQAWKIGQKAPPTHFRDHLEAQDILLRSISLS